MSGALFAVLLAASIPAGLRWLRVAQREHYLPGSVGRFGDRWWAKTGGPNRLLMFLLLFLLIVTIQVDSPWPGILVAAVIAAGPVGLTLRGRTSKLAWTPRLVRLAVLSGVLLVAIFLVAVVTNLMMVGVAGLILLPQVIDLALLTLAPVERKLGNKWVDQAERKLKAIGPEVVAITGSYGKTTTKGYVAHLLSGSKRVVASPASFNNRMGLARAINENLTPGTQVFVAEMGTYGKGEIADLCSWITPTVAAMVSIGPVHLERFKTEERIVEAKSEILDRAEVGVICIDHPLLAFLAGERSKTMEIVEVGTGDRGRVRVVDGQLFIDDRALVEVPAEAYPSNLAVAVGVALAMGMTADEIARRVPGVPSADHRLTVTTSDRGFTVIDDTFNSNPAGARRALQALVRAAGPGRKVLVTPGMIELGQIQSRENQQFASEASKVVDDIVIVGRTNRRALQQGSADGRAAVTVMGKREDAVAWVRSALGPGGAVLYENDLPDHYP
jgi:UDP-N-acetylmuramoyl-tripeptide--D-alanyl-D-alanine ligase